MITIARWQSLPQNLNKRNAYNFSDGLDQSISPLFIKDTSFVNGYGFDFGEFPALKVRDGRTAYGATGSATTRLLAALGTTKLIRIVGTTAQYDNAGTWTNIATGLTAAEYDFTNFEVGGVQAAIMVAPGSAPKYWDGTTFGTLGGSPPQASFVTNDSVRVWMAKDDIVYFSAFQDSEDFTTAENSGFVQYYNDRGGNITALRSYYGDKYVWKQDSMAVIQGTNFFNFKLKEISSAVGCASFKTVQEVDDTLFFMDKNDVYRFNGAFPVSIGDPVRGFLDTINSAAIGNSFSWTDTHTYYICFPTGSNTECDTCLAYSLEFKKWLPYSITLGSLRRGINYNGIPYAGDSSGVTFKLNTGSTDNGTAIPWRVQSKPFDGGVKEAEKELWEAHLQGLFPTGTTLTAEFAADDIGSTWYTINYDPTTASTATQNKNLIIPLDTVPLAHFYQYRLSGTAAATIQEVQIYSRIQPVQY